MREARQLDRISKPVSSALLTRPKGASNIGNKSPASALQKNDHHLLTQHMRILHVVPSYFPAVRYGGPIFAVHGLCHALAVRGHQVDVFTTNVDGPGISPVPVGIPVKLDQVTVRYFACPLFRRLYWAPALDDALD